MDNCLSKKESELNVWISFLKILSCFFVVIIHFGTGRITDFLMDNNILKIGVLNFTFLSFYLTSRYILNLDVEWLGKRIRRLYFPVIVWSIIYFFVFNLFRVLLKIGLIDIKELFFSMLTGSSERINSPMWFNITLIIVTLIIFGFTAAVGRENRMLSLSIGVFFILLVGFQYFNVNVYFFGTMPFESGVTIGRVTEMLPVALLGCLYGRADCMRLKTGIVHVILWVCVFAISRLIPLNLGFGYQGLPLMAMCMSICVLAISLPNVQINHITAYINGVARYTMGVYFSHIGVGWGLRKMFDVSGLISFKGIFFAGVVFLSCLICCWMLDLMFLKRANCSCLVR